MKYDLDYQGATEIFESRVITSIPPITGRLLENSYLRSSIRISLKKPNVLTRCFRR